MFIFTFSACNSIQNELLEEEHTLVDNFEEVSKSEMIKVEEETKITLSLDAGTRSLLEKRAFAQGKTLTEFLADEVPKLGN